MLFHAANRHDIDMQSWFINDPLNDVEVGRLTGARTILIDNAKETQWQLSLRSPYYLVANLTEAGQLITSVDIKPLIHFLPVGENTGA